MALKRSQTGTLIAAVSAVSSAVVAEIVHRIVPEPYLDEVFHIPQARAYCQGDWERWDPKLTTPPGLYLLSVGLHRIIPRALLDLPCESTVFLRSTNLLLLMCVPHLCSAILATTMKYPSPQPTEPSTSERSSAGVRADAASLGSVAEPASFVSKDPARRTVTALHQAASKPELSAARARTQVAAREARLGVASTDVAADAQRTAAGHVIASLPPLWFFGFLYYTDVGSLVTVLGCLLAAKTGRHYIGALVGATSLLFRQTNVVWVLFIVCTSLISQLRAIGLADPSAANSSPASLIRTLRQLVNLLLKPAVLRLSLSLVLPYAPVFLGFAAFLVWNGGIVLGDKTNHVPVLHFPQLLYFVVFSTAFGWPALLGSVPRASPRTLLTRATGSLVGSPQAVLLSVCFLATITAAVHKYTFEHPFLLADNRHYAFYVWRRIVKVHPLAKYALAPIYLVCGRLWWDAVGRTQSSLFMLGFLFATALTLVPSPLLEPRYFIVPYVLLRLHIKLEDDTAFFAKHPPKHPSAPLSSTTSAADPPSYGTDRAEDAMDAAAADDKYTALSARFKDERGAASSRTAATDGGSTQTFGGFSSNVANEWLPFSRSLALEALWFGAINAVTMYTFLMCPFKWPSEEGWQRFMW